MNRRYFLSLLAPAAILIMDPEELLWKPTKTIFIPKPVEAPTVRLTPYGARDMVMLYDGTAWKYFPVDMGLIAQCAAVLDRQIQRLEKTREPR